MPECIEIWLGDGICDDKNNMANCIFDGGDCCNPTADKTYCADCYCLDPSSPNYEGTNQILQKY
jgi:hypothetical protein